MIDRSDPAAAPASDADGSETILLVEDEHGVRRLAARILEARGYTVLAAENGQEALALASSHDGPIHLLLADVVMPGISGQRMTEELLARRPDVKVVYVSGYPEEEIARRGVATDGARFLQKPFTPAVLARCVREVLDCR